MVAVSGALSDDAAIERLRVATARHFATQHVALEAYRTQRKKPREAGAPAPILEGVFNAQCLMPNAQCPMPNAQCPMPNAQCPNAQQFLNAQCPIPNARCLMPDA